MLRQYGSRRGFSFSRAVRVSSRSSLAFRGMSYPLPYRVRAFPSELGNLIRHSYGIHGTERQEIEWDVCPYFPALTKHMGTAWDVRCRSFTLVTRVRIPYGTLRSPCHSHHGDSRKSPSVEFSSSPVPDQEAALEPR